MKSNERDNQTVFDPSCGSGTTTSFILRSDKLFTEKMLVQDVSGKPQVRETIKRSKFSEMPETALLSSREVMELFDVSRPTFARYRSKEELNAAERSGRKLFFRKADLLKWYENAKQRKKWPLQAIGRAKRREPLSVVHGPGSGKSHIFAHLSNIWLELLKGNNAVRPELEAVRDSINEALEKIELDPPF